jgi:hypothetical protein
MSDKPRYYRTVIRVEVLTEGPYDPEGLADVAEDIVHGDASGRWEVELSEEVSKEKMAELLEAQGSDPEFLLGEGWDELYCETCGNPMVVNQDGTTNHLVPDSEGVDDIDHDQDEDHVALAPPDED